MKRFLLLAGIGIALLAFASCASRAPVVVPHFDELPSLSMIWADYFPMGNIIASVNFPWQSGHMADIGNPAREHLLTRHFDIVTA